MGIVVILTESFPSRYVSFKCFLNIIILPVYSSYSMLDCECWKKKKKENSELNYLLFFFRKCRNNWLVVRTHSSYKVGKSVTEPCLLPVLLPWQHKVIFNLQGARHLNWHFQMGRYLLGEHLEFSCLIWVEFSYYYYLNFMGNICTLHLI